MDLIYRFNPSAPLIVNRPNDAQEAIQALTEGNQRLVQLVRTLQHSMLGESTVKEMVIPMDLLSLGLPFFHNVARDQAPFAIVLGCSDARVPIERVFDQSFNELFVIRIAGNVLGTECLGSFDYAVRYLGHSLRAVIVLGHTGCGAVAAAVDAYLNASDYADIAYTHPLRSLVDRIMIAVRGAAQGIKRLAGPAADQHPEFRSALIEAAVYLNAAITAFDLQREMSGPRKSAVDVFHGICNLNTMRVTAGPAASQDPPSELRHAPADSAELVALGDRIAAAVVEQFLV